MKAGSGQRLCSGMLCFFLSASGLFLPAAVLLSSDPLVPVVDPDLIFNPAGLKAAIDGGVGVDERDGEGNTPLHRICVAAHLDQRTFELRQSSRVLMEKGANVNARNNNGDTPLELLAFAAPDHYELAELLIENGADYRIIDSADRALVANFIAFGEGLGSLAVVRLVLAKHGGVNASLDPQGWTALHYAAAYGRDDIVEYLLEDGADPELKNGGGKTALQLAADSIRHRVERRKSLPPVRPAGSVLGRILQESRERRIAERDSSFLRICDLLTDHGTGFPTRDIPNCH